MKSFFKEHFYLFIFIVNLGFSQTTYVHNIFLQEFPFNFENVYIKKNNLIFYSKCYSNKEIKFHDLDFNDSLAFSDLNNISGKFEGYMRMEYRKDTILGRFDPFKFSTTNYIGEKSEKKLNFKNLPKRLISYECDNEIYDSLVFIKTFFLTSCVIRKDEQNKEYALKLINENCNKIIERDYDFNLQYYEDKNFLALKYNGSFIFVFDKYFF